MATRKKKDTTDEDMLLMTDAKSVLKNKPSNGYPIISQGTHLTVKTFEDGSTELIWDHDQLLKEVKEATSKFTYSEPKEVTNEDGSKSLVVSVTKKTKGKKNDSTQ